MRYCTTITTTTTKTACSDCRLSRAVIMSLRARHRMTEEEFDRTYEALSFQERTMLSIDHIHIITAGDIGEEQEETEVIPLPIQVPQPAPAEPATT